MEFYLPSIFIMLLAAIVTISFVPRFTPFVLVIFASLFLILAIYNHYSLFMKEYHNMNWANLANVAGVSPFLLSFLVVLLCVGYIIYLLSSGKPPSLPYMNTSIPSPMSATNIVTRGIGNSLVRSGLSNTSLRNSSQTPRNSYQPPVISPITNTSKRLDFESALAKAA